MLGVNKMKKIITSLVIMLSISFISVVAYTTDYVTEGEYKYYIENGEAILTDYYGKSEIVNVPSTIGGYPVIRIYAYTYSNCTEIITLNIPDSVKIVDYYAFSGCKNLKIANLGAGVEKIGGTLGYGAPDPPAPDPEETAAPYAQPPFQPAFYECSSLEQINVSEDNATFSSEDGVLFTKDKAMLLLCPCAKTGTYTVPEYVTSFELRGGNAWWASPFDGCDKLTGLIIGDNVEGEISDYTLDGLEYLYIGKDITKADGIWKSTKIHTIDVNSENSVYSSSDGVLYSADMSRLIKYPCAKSGEYKFPDNVSLKVIESGAFSFSQIKNIELPEGVEIINKAFCSCENLTKIVIPKSVSVIARNAFENTNSALTIYGYTGTCAETYAKDNDINFVALNSEEQPYNYAYEINGLSLFNGSGEEITSRPQNESFIAEVEVNKKTESDSKDYIFVAVYDKNGALLNIDYVKAKFAVGECSFGFNVPATSSEIGSIKAFVWSDFNSAQPLAEPKIINLN